MKFSEKHPYLFLILLILAFLILLAMSAGFFYGNYKKGQLAYAPVVSQNVQPTKYDNIKVDTFEEQADDQRYLLHVSYPVTENEKINEMVKNSAEQYMEKYHEAVEEKQANVQKLLDRGAPIETIHANFYQHFDVSFADKNYISFVFYREHNTGNTGVENTYSVTFSRKTGEKIPFADLFRSDDYLKRLSELSRDELLSRMRKDLADISNSDAKKEQEQIRKEMILEGTKPTEENFNSTYFKDDGTLVIVFNKYQVAAGYKGLVTVEIGPEKIADILKPDIRKLLHIQKPQIPEKENHEGEVSALPPKNIETNGADVDCGEVKCVALTFDDGPSVHTDRLLDILKEKGVHATFMVLGQSAKIQRNTILREYNEGHEIGNHTWDHKQLTKLSPGAVRSEVERTNQLVKSITGHEPLFVRPPYGSVSDEVRRVVNEPLIMWSVDPDDWKDRNTATIVKRIESHVRPGAIVLSHDIYSTTVDAIPQVIDDLRARGYHFVTVTELMAPQELKAGHSYRMRGTDSDHGNGYT